MINKKETQLIDRYKYGYSSPSGIYRKSKYFTHATYKKKERGFGLVYMTISIIILIAATILTFGCIEQLFVFFASLVFSTAIFKKVKA